MQPLRRVSGLVLGALVLAACGAPQAPAAASVATDTGMAEEVIPSAQDAAMTAGAASSTPPAEGESAVTEGESAMAEGDHSMAEGDHAMAGMTERPAWQQIALTDARTGTPFTLADFAGKTVFVEPFATWCGNCRQQLGNVHSAKSQAGEDVVFVALSVEPNIGNDALTQYAATTGYDLIFAALTPDLLQELAAQLGQTIANPPATPSFIIRADGSTTDLMTGFEAPEAVLERIRAAQG